VPQPSPAAVRGGSAGPQGMTLHLAPESRAGGCSSTATAAGLSLKKSSSSNGRGTSAQQAANAAAR
jgi:hypothetical protein